MKNLRIIGLMVLLATSSASLMAPPEPRENAPGNEYHVTTSQQQSNALEQAEIATRATATNETPSFWTQAKQYFTGTSTPKTETGNNFSLKTTDPTNTEAYWNAFQKAFSVSDKATQNQIIDTFITNSISKLNPADQKLIKNVNLENFKSIPLREEPNYFSNNKNSFFDTESITYKNPSNAALLKNEFKKFLSNITDSINKEVESRKEGITLSTSSETNPTKNVNDRLSSLFTKNTNTLPENYNPHFDYDNYEDPFILNPNAKDTTPVADSPQTTAVKSNLLQKFTSLFSSLTPPTRAQISESVSSMIANLKTTLGIKTTPIEENQVITSLESQASKISTSPTTLKVKQFVQNAVDALQNLRRASYDQKFTTLHADGSYEVLTNSNDTAKKDSVQKYHADGNFNGSPQLATNRNTPKVIRTTETKDANGNTVKTEIKNNGDRVITTYSGDSQKEIGRNQIIARWSNLPTRTVNALFSQLPSLNTPAAKFTFAKTTTSEILGSHGVDTSITPSDAKKNSLTQMVKDFANKITSNMSLPDFTAAVKNMNDQVGRLFTRSANDSTKEYGFGISSSSSENDFMNPMIPTESNTQSKSTAQSNDQKSYISQEFVPEGDLF